MKKIFLLFTIFISVLAASSQNSAIGAENFQAKNTQITSAGTSAEGFIDNLTVYPNPVVDVLKITFKSYRKSMAVISLFNNIGKQVYSQESEVEIGNNTVSVDIRNKAIEPGIYFVKCVAENDIFTRKLIVK